MQRKMESSGIEGMIKNESLSHISKSEEHVLAKKNWDFKILARDMARKLRAIVVQKVRGL